MPKTEKGKIKLRFFEVELEGSDETLLESIRSAAALANRLPLVRVPKQLEGPNGNGDRFNGSVAEPLGGTISEETACEDLSDAEAPTRTKKHRSYPVPEIVEIDLTGGEMPFRQFADAKNPTETIKKYLVCAVWLKEYAKVSPVDADHIYTCFRHMGWGVQRDIAQPLRDGIRQGYFKKAERGKFEATHIAIDAVHNMTADAPKSA